MYSTIVAEGEVELRLSSRTTNELPDGAVDPGRGWPWRTRLASDVDTADEDLDGLRNPSLRHHSPQGEGTTLSGTDDRIDHQRRLADHSVEVEAARLGRPEGGVDGERAEHGAQQPSVQAEGPGPQVVGVGIDGGEPARGATLTALTVNAPVIARSLAALTGNEPDTGGGRWQR